ncbi:hypothetical protein TNCT_337721 [Trichonephila clavata]|uniref:Uncharacterized protein n=1 Tax=Trichonephila clavata TaxID=2740835 RepID=A0A8X6FPF3_TRICU|nr:hypothetical protein TNCT_337721 [Trichonephila clavata]
MPQEVSSEVPQPLQDRQRIKAHSPSTQTTLLNATKPNAFPMLEGDKCFAALFFAAHFQSYGSVVTSQVIVISKHRL